MSTLSSSDLTSWTAPLNDEDELPPPYSLEDLNFKCLVDSIPRTWTHWVEKALPALSALPSSQTHNRRATKARSYTSRASDPFFQLGPINIPIGRNRHVSIAYLLKIRSSKAITLFRSTPIQATSGRSTRTTDDPALLPRRHPLYNISRSSTGQRPAISLESRTKDNLFSEPSSKLKLRKMQGSGRPNIWELYYHRNHDFESLVAVPALGSQTVLVFDMSSTWWDGGGKIVAVEEKADLYQDRRGIKAAADCTELPRIDIYGGLDQRFVDLIVACWIGKAYFS